MDRDFTIQLLCLLLSIAWTKGVLDEEESEMIRDFIEESECLTASDRLEYSNYFTQPFALQGRIEALNKLKSVIRTQEQIHYTIYSLRKMICADGQVDGKEQEIYESVRKELQTIALEMKQK